MTFKLDDSIDSIEFFQEEEEWDREQLLDPQWENLQKKAFIKWCNSILRRAGVQVEDIENDFRDGVKLLMLLELLTGETLPKPDRGHTKFHRIANVNKALDFLAGKTIQLVSISAEAIVDGNVKATMGLIWIIILSQLIDDISYEDQEGIKGLLLWCQSVFPSYESLKVENFDLSFKDGLVFCAMVNAIRPGLIDCRALSKDKPLENLRTAFHAAEKYLDVPCMLDPEDIVYAAKPDEKSIIAYVSTMYHASSRTRQVPSTKAGTKTGHAKVERGRSVRQKLTRLMKIQYIERNEIGIPLMTSVTDRNCERKFLENNLIQLRKYLDVEKLKKELVHH